jgi:hypothetical protein
MVANMAFSSARLVSFVPARKSGLHLVQRFSGPRVSGFYKNADNAVILLSKR